LHSFSSTESSFVWTEGIIHYSFLEAVMVLVNKEFLEEGLQFYGIPFIGLPVVALIVHSLTKRLAEEETSVDDEGKYDVLQVRATLDVITRDIVIVLGLLVTSSFVVLQMFAANFLPHTISLFFRNRGVFAILSFMCLSALFCGTVDVLTGEYFETRFAARVAFMTRFISLSVTFPYFNFLVNFLSPETLIKQVCQDGLDCISLVERIEEKRLDIVSSGRRNPRVAPSSEISHGFTENIMEERKNVFSIFSRKRRRTFLFGRESTALEILKSECSRVQAEWIDAVELLTDIGLSTLGHKDKENANHSMLSLYTIACACADAKGQDSLPEHWFHLSKDMKARPDFSSLSAQSFKSLVQNRTWQEWKILRAYQLLLETACRLGSQNLCGLAAFYTRKISELSAEKGDVEVVSLTIKFFNSFVAHLIRENKVRILTGVLNEYRELANELLRLGAVFRQMAHQLDRRKSFTEKPQNRRRNSQITSIASTLNSFTAASTKSRGETLLQLQFSQASTTSLNPKTMQLDDVRKDRIGRAKNRKFLKGSKSRQVKDVDDEHEQEQLWNHFQRLSTTVQLRAAESENGDKIVALKKRAKHCDSAVEDIARHMRYYLIKASDRNMGIVAEMVSHDVGLLCAEACRLDSTCHNRLLDIFLSLDDTQRGKTVQASTYRGIRKSQAKLAANYLLFGKEACARQILEDMKDEPMFRLKRVHEELISMEDDVFWEISFRSKNLDYLTPSQRRALNAFFEWFDGFKVRQEEETADEVEEEEKEEVEDAKVHEDNFAKEEDDKQQRKSRLETLPAELEAMARAPSSENDSLMENVELHVASKDRWLASIFFRTSVPLIVLLLIGLSFDSPRLMIDSGPLLHSISQSEANAILSGLAVGSVLVFVVLCVTSMIVLQVASARYKFHPNLLSFLRDPVLYSILSLDLITCMVCTLANISTGASSIPRGSIATADILLSWNIMLIGVYFVRLYRVLRPETVLGKIRESVLAHLRSVATHHERKEEQMDRSIMARHRNATHENIKRICDFGFACVKQSDETNLHLALGMLLYLSRAYSAYKEFLPANWFQISGKLRRTSEFINFSSRRIRDISEKKVWFEWKVLAQYLLIFEECTKEKRLDACQLIALNTRFMAEGFIFKNDHRAYDACTHFINTYLRLAINMKSIELSTHIILQYQRLSSLILRDKISKNKGEKNVWMRIMMAQTKFMKYYGQIALERNLGAITESVASLLGEICSLSLLHDKTVHLETLEVLLTLDDTADGDQDTLVGIRRAQVKLATEYLCRSHEEFAKMVAEDLVNETSARLKVVLRELLSTDRPEFWEVTDNGVPVEFLSDAEKSQLVKFFEMVELVRVAHGKQAFDKFQSITTFTQGLLSASSEELNRFRPRTLKETHGRRENRVAEKASSSGVNWSGKFGFRGLALSGGGFESVVSAFEHDPIQDEHLNDFFEGLFVDPNGETRWTMFFRKVFLPTSLNLIFVACVFGVCYVIDKATLSFGERLHMFWCSQKVVDTSLAMELVLRTFSVVVMCSIIALQKAPSRMVWHIWIMYRKSFWAQSMWAVNLTTIFLALWNHMLSESSTPRPGLSLLVAILASICILVVFPYFAHLFVFLDESKLLAHIVLDDVKLMRRISQGETMEGGALRQSEQVLQIVKSVERVADFASSTIRVKDKSNSFNSVMALYTLGRYYLEIKAKLPESFFGTFMERPSLANSSDFVRLSQAFKLIIISDKIWVEWKLLRQYLFLFQESLGHLPDVCYRIVTCTRLLAEAALTHGDIALLDLCLKFTNTFLRNALERNEVRLAFGITFQYRKLVENVLSTKLISSHAPISTVERERYVVDVMFYFRHYAMLAQARRIAFIPELILHDISTVCMTASRRSSKCHDEILKIFLQSYNRKDPHSRRGIRRVQLKLAAFYEMGNRTEEVELIMADVAKESDPDTIVRAYNDLEASEVSHSFWEVNERMYNIDHMVPAQHAALERMLERFLPSLQEACHQFRKRAMVSQAQFKKRSSSFMSIARRASVDTPEGLEATFGRFSREIAHRARIATRRVTDQNRVGKRVLGVLEHYEIIGTDTEHLILFSAKSLANVAWIPMAVVGFCVVLLCLLAASLDAFAPGVFAFQAPHVFFKERSSEDVRLTVQIQSKAAVVIFCIVLTPTLIMLQINSRHLLGIIAAQYFKDQRVFLLLFWHTFCGVFILWVHFAASSFYVANTPATFGTILVASLILSLFPYFGILFEFLDPTKVVQRMLGQALSETERCLKINKLSDSEMNRRKHTVNTILQQLTGFAGASILERDKHNFTNVVRVLSAYIEEYLKIKSAMDERWFNAESRVIRNSQDFVSLDTDQIVQMTEQRCWIENNLLRKYLVLFDESLAHMPESCLLVCIETVKMGQRAIEQLDYHTIDLVIKMLNTFIRSGLNKRAVRAVYNTLHQYRQLAELLIVSSAGERQALNRLAVSVSQYLRYYASVAASMNLEFIIQVIAYDIASMCETAYLLGFDNFMTHDRMLSGLLSMFDFLQVSDSGDMDRFKVRERLCAENGVAVESIARAAVRLASLFVDMNDNNRARCVAAKLHEVCTPSALEHVRDRIESVTTRDFWEVNDRGANFDFLCESRRLHLHTFFAWMNDLEKASTQANPMTTVIMVNSEVLPESSAPAQQNSIALQEMVNDEAEEEPPSLRTVNALKGLSAIALGHSIMRRKINRIRAAKKAQEQALLAASLSHENEEDVNFVAEKKEGAECENEAQPSDGKRFEQGFLSDITAARDLRGRSMQGNSNTLPTRSELGATGFIDRWRGHTRSQAAAEKYFDDQHLRSEGNSRDGHSSDRERDAVSDTSPFKTKETSAWQQALYTIPLAYGILLVPSLLFDCLILQDNCTMKGILSGFTTERSYIVNKVNTIGVLSLVLLTFLGSIVTVSTIVLQIVSTRYTPRVAVLFLRNAKIAVSLLVFFVFAVFVHFQASMVSTSFVSPAGFAISLCCFAVAFVTMLPFIAYLLKFLDASHIFRVIANDGLSSALQDLRPYETTVTSISITSASLSEEQQREVHPVPSDGKFTENDLKSVPKHQIARVVARKRRHLHVITSLDLISDFTLGALRSKDKRNAFEGVDLICAMTVSYIKGKMQIRRRMQHPTEFSSCKLSHVISKDPDFVNLSEELLVDLEKNMLWVEWKALRQLLKMFELSLGTFNDAVFRIARGFRHIGQTALQEKDINGLHLCVKFLNTIQQISIAKENDRAADTIMIQSRFLIEFVLELIATCEDLKHVEIVKDSACEMISYMHHYAQVSQSKRQDFITEHLLHDLCTISAFAHHLDFDEIEETAFEAICLFLFESHVKGYEENGNDLTRLDYLPRGVLRALIKLAAIYITDFGHDIKNADSMPRRIMQMLRKIHSSTICSLWLDFKRRVAFEDIEISDRGINVDALTSRQHKTLPILFSFFQHVDMTHLANL